MINRFTIIMQSSKIDGILIDKHKKRDGRKASQKEHTVYNDRTERFDNSLPCTKKKICKLYHVINWLSVFADIMKSYSK